MEKMQRTLIKSLALGLIVMNLVTAFALPCCALAAEPGTPAPNESQSAPARPDALAIAIVVGLACIAAGYAVAHVASAAIGIISEKPEMFGRTLVFVGLAEGIAIYGLIIGIMLMSV